MEDTHEDMVTTMEDMLTTTTPTTILERLEVRYRLTQTDHHYLGFSEIHISKAKKTCSPKRRFLLDGFDFHRLVV